MFFTHVVTLVYHFRSCGVAIVDLTLFMDNLCYWWRVLICILTTDLLWRYELALYDVIVNYRANGLLFIAAVFGLAASIAVVLLTSGIWNVLELISTPFPASNILWAGTLLGNELGLILRACVCASIFRPCDYAYQCLSLPVAGMYVLLRIIVPFYVGRSLGWDLSLCSSYPGLACGALFNGVCGDGLVLRFMAGGGFLLLLVFGGCVVGLPFTVFGGSPCHIVGNVCRSLLLLGL